MKLLTDTQSGSEVVTRDPSDECFFFFFKKDKNNIEERLCVVSDLDYILIKYTRSFTLEVVQESPLGNDTIEF